MSQIRLSTELTTRVEALADREHRSLSRMTAILIEEALEARKHKTRGPAPRPPTQITDADAQRRDAEARTVRPDFK